MNIAVPLALLLLLHAGVLWLIGRHFGFGALSLGIAVLAVLNLCPWYTPYATAEPFLLGQPWWLTVWFGISFLLFVLLYIRLFQLPDPRGSDDLPALWDQVRAQVNHREDPPGV